MAWMHQSAICSVTFEKLCDAYGGTENECGNDDGGPATDEEWDTDAWEV